MKSLLCKVIGHNWSRTRRKVSKRSKRKKAIDVKNQWHQKCHRCNRVRAVNVSQRKEPVFVANLEQLQQQGA
jgi:hypothetical protein